MESGDKVVIGLLRLEKKKFDHGNKIWFSLFDETFLCISFCKTDKRLFIGTLEAFLGSLSINAV